MATSSDAPREELTVRRATEILRWWREAGVDLAGGERAMDIVHDMSASGLFGCIVVDSVSALVPQNELEADFEENTQPGRQAHLMSRALRRLVSVVAKNNVLLLLHPVPNIPIRVELTDEELESEASTPDELFVT